MADVPDLSVQEAAVLARGLADLPHDESAVARALGRTAAHDARLRAESLSVPEAAARLSVTTARVRQMLLSGALYGFKMHGAWAIPPFQFVEGKVIPNLAPVVASLPAAMHPLSVERWFTLPNPDLRGSEDQAISPRDWLAGGGDPGPVARLARDL